ncbi:MAG: NUDIX hydrolase [Verrucomicrobiota bacterium]|nr:NUDIX hydrolase [Verrucomicrobiota bacterium]
MEKPTLLTSELVFRGFFDVQQDLLQRENGHKHSYLHFVLPLDAAVVLAETPDGQLVLNREYRHATGKYLLGCPGGTLNPNEDPLTGGTRELLEETGYTSDDITLLGCAYPFPALCNQKIYYLSAKNAYLKAAPHRDPFELIDIELKTEKQLRKEIAEGAIVDGLLLTALFLKKLKE